MRARRCSLLVPAAMAVAIGLAALAAGCGAGPERRAFVLVTLDTVRADRLGCYGYTRAATPVLDRLAREGARFDAATSVTPMTLPAHASILTGRYPVSTGVRGNSIFVLGGQETTLGEAFRGAGFRTAAFVGSFVLSSCFGLSQGFDVYDESFDPGRRRGMTAERSAASVNAAVFRWLDGAGEGPLFLWVHYYDPHTPYRPPPPFDRTFAASPYDGEIAATDRALGELLARLEDRFAPADLAVMVVGDHGEGLWEHGEEEHGLFVYESTLNVPLILRAAGRVPAGATVAEPVSLVDLFDTALELVPGVTASGPARHGTSLMPLLRGESVSRSLPVSFESYLSRLEFGWSELRGLRQGPLKLIAAPRPELFDLSGDASEGRNLASERPGELAGLSGQLDRAYTELAASAAAAESRPVDEESMEKLLALGYIAGAAPGGVAEASGGALADPKDRLEFYNDLKRATRDATRGPAEVASAIATMERLLSEEPANAAVRRCLATALLRAERAAEVLSLLRPHLQGGPEYYWVPLLLARAYRAQGEREKALEMLREEARRNTFFESRQVEIAALLREMGRIEESLAEAEKSLARNPSDADLLELAADNSRDLGRVERAVELYRKALDLSPELSSSSVSLAHLLIAARRLDEAEEVVSRLLGRLPDDPQGRMVLGLVEMNRGRFDRAVAELRRARSLDPSDPEAAFHLVVCLTDSGRLDEADSESVELLRLAPSSAHTYRALGGLRERQGRLPEAREAFRRAVSLDPSDAASAESLRRLPPA